MKNKKDGGIYKEEGAKIKEELQAEAIIMLVLKGKRGDGIFVSSNVESLAIMPRILRTLANELESDLIRFVQDKIEEN
jgi:hypothetical protein